MEIAQIAIAQIGCATYLLSKRVHNFLSPEYIFFNSLDLHPFRPMPSHSTGLLLSMNAPLEIV